MASTPSPRNSAAALLAAAQRRGRVRQRANGDVMSNSYGVNRNLPPGPNPIALPKPRAGRKFEIGLTQDGRIVHLYHNPGQKPTRIVLPSTTRQALPPGVQSRVTVNPQSAARRARKGRTVTYGNRVSGP